MPLHKNDGGAFNYLWLFYVSKRVCWTGQTVQYVVEAGALIDDYLSTKTMTVSVCSSLCLLIMCHFSGTPGRASDLQVRTCIESVHNLQARPGTLALTQAQVELCAARGLDYEVVGMAALPLKQVRATQ